MSRTQQLNDWLQQQLPKQHFELAPASADASFRQYFRITFRQSDQASLIVMDAPPEHEDCRPFVQVCQLLQQAGVHVPTIHAQDLEQGFLLLSDMGHRTYLQQLDTQRPMDAGKLYDAATDALINIQLASKPGILPEYNRERLLREMQLFPDWYIDKHLNAELSEFQQGRLKTTFEHILSNNLAQPQVFVHRDYHSRNLMLSQPNPGILDFQDAVYGPITYDLVSLFKDAYIYWEEPHILEWLIRYWEKARRAKLPVAADFGEFYRDFDWMGVQRHLKVLGIFARLSHRDGKAEYLKDIPLVRHQLRASCARYVDLKPLLNILDTLEPDSYQEGYTF